MQLLRNVPLWILSSPPMDKGKVEAITLQLEELTKDVTWRGGRPEDMPDTDAMFEELWWEVKHNCFCGWEIGNAFRIFRIQTIWRSRLLSSPLSILPTTYCLEEDSLFH